MYKGDITEEMTWLSKQRKSVFIGEGLINAGRVYETLSSVPKKKCVEMPIAENLIVGVSIGLAIQGYRPIVVFQRMDFMLVAADAIINHLALIPKMSGGQFTLPIILRAIVGSQSERFDIGLQHKHDFTHIFEPYIDTRVFKKGAYKWAYEKKEPILIIEQKDLYEQNNNS